MWLSRILGLASAEHIEAYQFSGIYYGNPVCTVFQSFCYVFMSKFHGV